MQTNVKYICLMEIVFHVLRIIIIIILSLLLLRCSAAIFISFALSFKWHPVPTEWNES